MSKVPIRNSGEPSNVVAVRAEVSRERDLQLAVRELEFLQRLSQSAASTRDSGELVELIIQETTAAIGTDVCSLYLVESDGRELALSATNGLNERMVGQVSMKIGEGITGWVAQTRDPKLVADVSVDPHWKWVPGLDEERFRSMLSVPIESGPRLVGVLNVQSIERRDFTDEDVDFLRAIAGQVAGILERSELQRRLEAQLAEIKLSHAIHERFTRLSLEGAGIPMIMEAVGSLAGGPAALYSAEGFRVRGSGESQETGLDGHGAGGNGLEGSGPESDGADRNGLGDRVHEGKGADAKSPGGLPDRLQLPPAILVQGMRKVRISAGRPRRPIDLIPVRAGAGLLGVLAVVAGEAPVDPDGRRRSLEHGSTVLALELSKERAAAEVERRLRGDLVEELLAGGLEDQEAERLARQADRLGHRLPDQAWVIVLEPDDVGDEAKVAMRRRQDGLDLVLTDMVRRRFPGALCVVRSASGVVLVPADAAPELNGAERLGELLLAAAAPVLRPATASVGIGNLAASVGELARSHTEARQALRLSRRAGGQSRVTSYRSLGAFRLLLDVQSPEVLRGFANEVLGQLLKYAESRETPLLATLEALAGARWIRRAAARDLGIHINSINYRIERIQSLTGLSLDDPETRVAIAIALRARSMLGR
jgi:sugar diacid utilization regulator/putative methionine-R-sulfoxide reductase with GAF domain